MIDQGRRVQFIEISDRCLGAKCSQEAGGHGVPYKWCVAPMHDSTFSASLSRRLHARHQLDSTSNGNFFCSGQMDGGDILFDSGTDTRLASDSWPTRGPLSNFVAENIRWHLPLYKRSVSPSLSPHPFLKFSKSSDSRSRGPGFTTRGSRYVVCGTWFAVRTSDPTCFLFFFIPTTLFLSRLIS